MNSPYLQTNFLNSRLCNNLIDYYKFNVKKTKRPNNGNSDFNDRILYFDDIKDKILYYNLKKKVIEIINKIKRKYKYNHDIYPDSIHIVKWNKGQLLGEHADAFYLDGTPNYTPYRKFSSICFLNDDFVGGELKFTNYKGNVIPKTGNLAYFKADLDHRHQVFEVKEGERYTLACWFTDDISKSVF